MALDRVATRPRRKRPKPEAVNRWAADSHLDMLALPGNAKEPPDFEALLRSLPRFEAREAQSLRKAIAIEREERRRNARETAD